MRAERPRGAPPQLGSRKLPALYLDISHGLFAVKVSGFLSSALVLSQRGQRRTQIEERKELFVMQGRRPWRVVESDTKADALPGKYPRKIDPKTPNLPPARSPRTTDFHRRPSIDWSVLRIALGAHIHKNSCTVASREQGYLKISHE